LRESSELREFRESSESREFRESSESREFRESSGTTKHTKHTKKRLCRVSLIPGFHSTRLCAQSLGAQKASVQSLATRDSSLDYSPPATRHPSPRIKFVASRLHAGGAWVAIQHCR